MNNYIAPKSLSFKYPFLRYHINQPPLETQPLGMIEGRLADWPVDDIRPAAWFYKLLMEQSCLSVSILAMAAFMLPQQS